MFVSYTPEKVAMVSYKLVITQDQGTAIGLSINNEDTGNVHASWV